MVSDAGRSHRVILLIAASISASVGLGFCLSSETAAMIRSPASVLPAFSLKFKIQEFKMAKNGHGGKRAGAGRPPLLPAEAKPERMKGAAGDITLSPARLLSPASPWR